MDRCLQLLEEILGAQDKWIHLWNTYLPQWHKKSQANSSKNSTTESVPILDEQLAILISYGDSVREAESDNKPLQTLYKFLDEVCEGSIKGLHVLPFFPYSSDDGFSISDYRMVREDLGDWQDIKKISLDYYFMGDLVLNHCSSKHEWFKKFLENKEPYNDYFIVEDPHKDYSQVVRPRPHFILSEYASKDGTKHVWTTFSKDQVDLNFANPKVVFEMLDIMLEYVLDHNIALIRLDAIAYLWKELGTPCIHHHTTHLVVKLMRALLDSLAPETIIITETNVPHEENISYFGDYDEAHMVYQFPLPPLLLHAMISESTKYLQEWARSIPAPKEKSSYFNFCASHDGIGMTPTHGILPQKEQDKIIEAVKQRGGLISYKATDKGEIPYELNINYLSAVAPSELPNHERAKIFLASQAVLLAMPGVPGIYIHSLLGSENWNHGVKTNGYNRAINRQHLDFDRVMGEIAQEGSLRQEVFNRYLELLDARAASPAFHPFTAVQILEVHDGLFAILRDGESVGSKDKVLCIANLSPKEIVQHFPNSLLPFAKVGEDLINGDVLFFTHEHLSDGKEYTAIAMEPYEILWIRFNEEALTNKIVEIESLQDEVDEVEIDKDEIDNDNSKEKRVKH